MKVSLEKQELQDDYMNNFLPSIGDRKMALKTNMATSTRYGNTDNQKSEIFLKVGYDRYNEELSMDEFVSVPMPLFLDTMKPNTISGEGSFQELLCLGNDLLEQLIQQAKASLAPGESKELKLKVVICRRKASQADNHQKVKVDLGF